MADCTSANRSLWCFVPRTGLWMWEEQYKLYELLGSYVYSDIEYRYVSLSYYVDRYITPKVINAS